MGHGTRLVASGSIRHRRARDASGGRKVQEALLDTDKRTAPTRPVDDQQYLDSSTDTIY